MFANEHNMGYVLNDDLANDTPNAGVLRVNDDVANDALNDTLLTLCLTMGC